MADRIPELLCPAGSREAALAALCNGADALYLGASALGARANAGFDGEGLRDIIGLCHFHGRRVYVTVNTLVKERELPGLRDTLGALQALGADAVLVQDMGVLRLIREEFPCLCVHASTQMALHSAAGARLLQGLGVQRVVLARECTLEAIRAVAETGVETEVFVHGAQCVCVSGQCRCSGLIGGRSGNRGRCAQPCRLPYEWQGKTAAWLSPRDNCLRDHLKELRDAGAASLKIEGRLKRPEYVAVVTRAYRQALDALAEGRFAPAGKEEREALSQVFSRTFFPGYAFGARDAAVMNSERASSAGVEIGSVLRAWKKGSVFLAEAKLTKALGNGDGLQLRGSREQDMVYSGGDVPAGERAVLRLHFPARAGDRVVRIDEEAQLRLARESYARRDALPRVHFDAELTLRVGEPARLRVWDGRAEAEAEGETVQAAQSAPLDEKRARRALEKTGDTGYALRGLRMTGEEAFLSAAGLNELRRRALEGLTAARLAAWKRPESRFLPLPEAAGAQAGPPRLYVRFTDAALAKTLRAAGAEELVFSPADVTAPALEAALDALPAGAWVDLPVQLTDAALCHMRRAARERGLRLCAGSVGQLMPGEEMMAGEGVPCWNHLAADTLSRLGVSRQVLPRELKGTEIDEMLRARPAAEMILPVYGRARLMYLNHCPARTALGLSGARQGCDLCERGRGCLGQALTDRRGERFPLLPVRMEEGCLVQLLSCQVRSLSERAPRALSWLLDFTVETPEEAAGVTAAYCRLRQGCGDGVPGSLERFDAGVE